MSSNLVTLHCAALSMWAFGLCVLWSTRELNTRPIRPDWRKIWARRVFGVWCRYFAIFCAVFSGIWLIHDLGGFWEVAEMSSRDRHQILKEKNGDLAAFLESRQNQLKGILSFSSCCMQTISSKSVHSPMVLKCEKDRSGR